MLSLEKSRRFRTDTLRVCAFGFPCGHLFFEVEINATNFDLQSTIYNSFQRLLGGNIHVLYHHVSFHV